EGDVEDNGEESYRIGRNGGVHATARWGGGNPHRADALPGTWGPAISPRVISAAPGSTMPRRKPDPRAPSGMPARPAPDEAQGPTTGASRPGRTAVSSRRDPPTDA